MCLGHGLASIAAKENDACPALEGFLSDVSVKLVVPLIAHLLVCISKVS